MTSSQHNPDERDLLDFADAVAAGQNPQPLNDLERTYLHVQKALQGDSAAIPSTTKQSTWEDVMSTLALTPEAPVSNRTRRQQGLSSPPPLTAKPRRMKWTPLASIAAAALVIVASFGVWFTSGNDSTPPPVEPRQVAGLTAGEVQQIATPEASYACDFTQDMPMVSTNEQLPVEGTHLVWQEGGDLILRCDEEPNDIVLASDISQAGPVEGIPGLVTVYYPADDSTELAMGQSHYINITTGDSFTAYNAYNSDPGFFQQPWGDYRSGPFLFVHNEDAILVLLDTRSMTAMPVGELFGESAPQSFNLLQTLSDDGSTMALMLGDQVAANSGHHPMPALRGTETGADGDILLLNMETGESNWLTITIEDSENLTGMSLSPDATLLAVTSAPGADAMATEARVMMVSTEDGTILNESETFATFDTQSLWTERGLVIQTAQDLLFIPANGAETSVLYSLDDSATTMQGLLPTLDPNVIVATSILCEGECRIADADVSVVAINVATGETKEFSGQNVAQMTWAETAHLLLMTDPGISAPDTTTYTVIDPVSGQTVATFDDIPGVGITERQMPLIGAKSIGMSTDGQTMVVSIGMQNMIELKSDGTEHSARLLPAPGRWAEEGSGNPTASIFLSPDGTQLSAMAQGDEAQTRFILDLTDPDAEWVTVETTAPGGGGYILFVEGVPAD